MILTQIANFIIVRVSRSGWVGQLNLGQFWGPFLYMFWCTLRKLLSLNQAKVYSETWLYISSQPLLAWLEKKTSVNKWIYVEFPRFAWCTQHHCCICVNELQVIMFLPRNIFLQFCKKVEINSLSSWKIYFFTWNKS